MAVDYLKYAGRNEEEFFCIFWQYLFVLQNDQITFSRKRPKTQISLPDRHVQISTVNSKSKDLKNIAVATRTATISQLIN